MNPAYVALMGLSIAVGGWLLRRTQAALPLSPREKLGVGLGAFCGAMLGAKLPFVFAADWESIRSGLAWFEHGKTILGGIAGGYLGVEYAKFCLDLRVRTGDSFAQAIPVAVAIGRTACFFGGCCFGAPTSLPWGVIFPTAEDDPPIPRHPTQLYEAAFHLALSAVIWDLARQGVFRGNLIKFYLIAYLTYRFVSEFIRPEARVWAGLTGYQSAALVLIGLFAWLWRRDAIRFAKERAS